jgi:hypothetical protein
VKNRFLILLLILSFFLIVPFSPQASQGESLEYRLKAAFIYKITDFIDWPLDAFEDKSSPLTISVIGRSPFFEGLNSLKEEKLKNRKLILRSSQKIDEQTKSSHIVVVGALQEYRLEKILASLKNSHALIIGENQGFCQKGGILNLVIKKGKIRFEINLKKAKQSGLKVSSRVLRMAKIVE